MSRKAKKLFCLIIVPIITICLILFISGYLLYLAKTAKAQTEVIGLVRQDCTGYPNCFTSLSDWETAYGGIDFGACPAGDLVCADKIATAQIDGPWTNPDTAAVTIDGWTTDATHYIRVYTTTNARHSGTWDTGKYRLEVADASAMIISEDYVNVDSLQVRTISSDGGDNVLTVDNINQNNNIKISNSILRGHGSNTYPQHIIDVLDSDAIISIWNNIIYDQYAVDDNSRGIYLNVSSAYVYNNTVIGGFYGIMQEGGNVIAKNNIVQSCSDGFYGVFDASSDYNLSDLDSDAPGANSKNSSFVIFTGSSGSDFHLSPYDMAATKNGTDLSADPYLSFTTDIDGSTRSDIWDIGADEAVINVYYSVGQNTNDHKVGGSILTMSIQQSGIAFFNIGQSDFGTGVGDKITYNTSSVVYISEKIDIFTWRVVTVTGETPADITDAAVDSITHEFASLSEALAGTSDSNHLNTTDLVSGNYAINLPCYYDTGSDTTAVTIDGWTTSAANHIKIYAPSVRTTHESNQAQRHQGKSDASSGYKINPSDSTSAISIQTPYTKIEGIEILDFGGSGAGASGVYIGSSAENGVVLHGLLIHDEAAGNNGSGIRIDAASAGGHKIYNNIIYNCYDGILDGRTSQNESYVYNNTVVDCAHFGFSSNSPGIVLKNNLVQNCSDGFYGVFNALSNYNLSDLASDAPGPNSKNSTNVIFFDEASDDFHLAVSDTAAQDSGEILFYDASLPIPTDIDGSSRWPWHQWDIGADEVAVPIYRSVAPAATSALATGTSNPFSISGSTATFTAPLPGDVGVGDAIQYDTNNDGTVDAVSFVYQRIDSTHYIIKSVSGELPSNFAGTDTDWSIFRAYTSLSNAVKLIENNAFDDSLKNFDYYWQGRDLISANEQWNIALYANGTTRDTSPVVIGTNWASFPNYENDTFWTTSAANYIRIYTPVLPSEVGASQRHNGKWDDGKYQLEVTRYDFHDVGGNTAIRVYEPYVWIDGLQIKHIASDSDYGVPSAVRFSIGAVNSDLRLSNSIMRANFTGTVGGGSAVGDSYGAFSDKRIWNNIIYDYKRASGGISYGIYLTGGNAYVYNNTVYNSNYCYAFNQAVSPSSVFVAKNNIAQNCANYGFWSFSSLDSSSGYNISNLSDAPGANSKNGATVSFVDTITSDFHLADDDSVAINSGTDLSQDVYLAFSSDIDGQDRLGAWDIGADEIDNTAPADITDLAVSNPATDSFTLDWTAPGDDADLGTAVSYDIRYSISLIDDANWDAAIQVSGEPAPQAAGDPETMIVSGLDADTTYYFAIKTSDEVPNESGLSNVASGTTLPDSIPPSSITDLGVSNPTTDSITLTWTAPGDNDSTGTAASYDVRYSTFPMDDLNWVAATQVSGEPAPQIAGSVETMVITGLNPDTTYYFAIKTSDEVPNESGLSNVVNRATLPQTPKYSIVSLGTVDDYLSVGFGINDSRQIVGRITDSIDNQIHFGDASFSFIWNDIDGIQPLLDLGEGQTKAVKINNLGQIVGASNDRPVLWDSGSSSPQDLGTLGGATGYAFGINNSGKIVGWADMPTVNYWFPYHAFLYDNGTMTDLGTLTTSNPYWQNGYSLAYDINNLDQVVGVAMTDDWSYHCFVWDSVNGMVDLGTYPGHPEYPQCSAVAINDSGTIVGHAIDNNSNSLPLIFGNGMVPPTPIIMPSDFPYGELYNINGSGQAVGVMWEPIGWTNGKKHAILYDNQKGARDLNGLIPQDAGWELIFARDINENGEIVGYGTLNGEGRAFLLTPVGSDAIAPSAITDLAASNPTTDSITLAWTAPGDDDNTGTAASYDVRYSTSLIDDSNWAGATQVSGEPAPQIAGSVETMVITGLNPDTTYYFAIKTSDEVPNESGLSNVASGTTLPDSIPPSSITDLGVSNPTTDSITLTWTAPGDDDNTGTAASYDVRYSTSLIDDSNWAGATQVSGEPAPQIAGSVETMVITGLNPDTTYYFAIKTSDEVPNESGLSNVASGTTLSDPVSPSAITDLAASNPTTDSITLAWTAPGNDDSTGTAASYDVRYSTSLIDDSNWDAATQVTGEPAPQVAGSAETMTITGLSQDTTYYFAVKTSDEVPNESGLSNVASGKTLTAGDVNADYQINVLDVQACVNHFLGIQDWGDNADVNNDGSVNVIDVQQIVNKILGL